MQRIGQVGLNKWLREQNKRRQILESLLADYNEGRSCSFYCVASALMPPDSIEEAMNRANEIMVNNEVDDSDMKAKAKILRSVIEDFASKPGIDLKLRRKPK